MPGRRWIILAILFAARAATGFQFQSVGSSAQFLKRAALLVVVVPLSLSFASLANRRQIADHSLETEWRAAS